jgi:cobalt-precorrin 5A hydrolase/precorrin-3B C17-methyltransferase
MSPKPSNQTPAILVLGPGGLEVARRVGEALPGARLHGLAGRVEGADQTFESFADQARALFAASVPMVGICATGALIRVLAPLIDDKRVEPPVIAVAEDASAVVPLLGGHRGANDMARDIAAILGIAPAITTAGDLRFGVALDTPPPGWRLANEEDAKPFVAALLAGASVRLDGDAAWLRDSQLPFGESGDLTISVTDRVESGGPRHLVYHPATLALGVGCERGAAAGEVLALARETLAEAGLAPAAVAGVFSIDLKSDEPAMHELAEALDVPARFFDAATLEAETPRLANPSDTVFREVGAHGVAEAAALAAAGPDGVLVAPKRKSRRATCAIARAPGIVEAASTGRPRGSLAIVGIGPGAADWRTPEAESEIAAAHELVGYRLYLDLLGGLADGKIRHEYGLGEEQARVRHAIELAAAGKRVALVCSGDAGIYAMAALAFEELERPAGDDWGRIAVTICPGISAMQAAAARAGAPLGHDFCAVSLSDLLTPWPVIERRLRAAAEGDFVTALYNPVSGRRRHQLARAREIMLGQRPPDTPVVLARNLGREGESVSVVTLDELTPDMADMLTLVLVGSSATRRVATGAGAWVYTPRGYADKEKALPENAA